MKNYKLLLISCLLNFYLLHQVEASHRVLVPNNNFSGSDSSSLQQERLNASNPLTPQGARSSFRFRPLLDQDAVSSHSSDGDDTSYELSLPDPSLYGDQDFYSGVSLDGSSDEGDQSVFLGNDFDQMVTKMSNRLRSHEALMSAFLHEVNLFKVEVEEKHMQLLNLLNEIDAFKFDIERKKISSKKASEGLEKLLKRYSEILENK